MFLPKKDFVKVEKNFVYEKKISVKWIIILNYSFLIYLICLHHSVEAQKKLILKDSTSVVNRSFWAFSFGGALGSNNMEIKISETNTINLLWAIITTSNNWDVNYEVDYGLTGLGLERNLLKKNARLYFGSNILYGGQREVVTNDIVFDEQLRLFSINPYVGYDLDIVGVRFGLHIGNISMLYNYFDERGNPPISQLNIYRIIPAFAFRIGSLSNFFIETDFMTDPYTTFAGSSMQFKLAHGLGLKNSTVIKVGSSIHNGLLFELQLPILKKFLINGQLAAFRGFFTTYEEEKHFRGSLELRYRW